MAIRQPVYFNETIDGDLWQHAAQYGNFSAYVKKLIRLDIERGLTKPPKPKRTPPPSFPATPPKLFSNIPRN
ncbi:hypothetical protein WD019_16065 [Fictibacillus sp. Mic-4]|uniref:hypothetical protein n=1 Tax=Fictibacillus sp. Mic-4 TaxID=3132826 RepID=UPI003CEF7834